MGGSGVVVVVGGGGDELAGVMMQLCALSSHPRECLSV